jgi:hypothetical protein
MYTGNPEMNHIGHTVEKVEGVCPKCPARGQIMRKDPRDIQAALENLGGIVREAKDYESKRDIQPKCNTSWVQPIQHGIVLNGIAHSGLAAHICFRELHPGGEPCRCKCGLSRQIALGSSTTPALFERGAELERIASEIVDGLFTHASGERADRLALITLHGVVLGAWSADAMRKYILDRLLEASRDV